MYERITVRNSWGADWGDKGSIKIQKGVRMCGIEDFVFRVSAVQADIWYPVYG